MNNLLKIIYNFIKIQAFNYGMRDSKKKKLRDVGPFFLKENFVFWWGLWPRPNLPRPWAALFKAPIFLSNNFCQKLRITFKAQMEVREIKYWIILQILSFKTNAHKRQRPLLYFKFSTNQFLLIFIPPHIHFFHYILFFFEKWHQQLELGRS